MKTILKIIICTVFIAGCNTAAKEHDAQLAKQAVLDSVHNAAVATAARQHAIDSMSLVAADKEKVTRQQAVVANSSGQSQPAKKRMSNTTKGALIGGGAGAVTGAVAGAVLSKDKGKGAVIGGIIGAATGAGVGAASGRAADKKKEKEKQ